MFLPSPTGGRRRIFLSWQGRKIDPNFLTFSEDLQGCGLHGCRGCEVEEKFVGTADAGSIDSEDQITRPDFLSGKRVRRQTRDDHPTDASQTLLHTQVTDLDSEGLEHGLRITGPPLNRFLR